jgi:hypothetical protein
VTNRGLDTTGHRSAAEVVGYGHLLQRDLVQVTTNGVAEDQGLKDDVAAGWHQRPVAMKVVIVGGAALLNQHTHRAGRIVELGAAETH